MFDSVWYNHNMKTVSIRWRLFLMFLLLLGPVCVLILFIQGKFYGIMKHQASMYTAQYIEKISYDIELNLSELDKMAVALQKDAAVEQALLGGDIQPAELQKERILSENSLAQRNRIKRWTFTNASLKRTN